MNHADGTAPIYAQLIRERGDVPGDVRQAAEEVLRDLSRVIRVPAPSPAGHQGGALPAVPGQVGHHQGGAQVGAPTGHMGLPGLPAQGGHPGMGAGAPGHQGIVAAHRSMQQ
ncbi:hypothetical protein [Streptomyces sp. NPDC003327]